MAPFSSYYALTPVQRQLLQATLMSSSGAVDAWQQWRNQVDIEALDVESHYVLSSLYPNLRHHNVNDPHLARLKGVYRRTWYGNQLRVKQLKGLIETLQSSQIDVLLLDDMARLTTCYADYGERTIDRFALLVSVPDTQKAFRVLQQQGWQSYRAEPEANQRIWQPIEFRNSDYFSLTLHSHIFWATPQAYTDSQLWEQAIAVTINGVATQALSPVDQLLRLSLALNQRDHNLPIYVLVDATKLVQSITHPAGWIRLLSQAQRYEMILPLRYLLTELQTLFEVDLPPWVLPNLAKMPISYHELLAYNLRPDNKTLQIKAQLVKLRARWKKLTSSSSTQQS